MTSTIQDSDQRLHRNTASQRQRRQRRNQIRFNQFTAMLSVYRNSNVDARYFFNNGQQPNTIATSLVAPSADPFEEQDLFRLL
jgi:hypothetical protein